MQSNDAGTPVSTVLETKWLDLGNPFVKKKTGMIGVVAEQGDHNISYRLDLGDKKTDWEPLGIFKAGTSEKKLGKEYYRIKLKATTNELNTPTVLNVLALRDNEATEKVEYAD